MQRLILINGCGGAGKDTTARHLLTHMSSCAWLDIKPLITVEPWMYGDTLIDLGIRNAAALTANFFDAGYSDVIFSGGVRDQRAVDLVSALVPTADHIYYVWLHTDKTIRDQRRIARARDDADRPEYLDGLDTLIIDPGPLVVHTGSYHRLDTGGRTVAAVVDDILAILAEQTTVS